MKKIYLLIISIIFIVIITSIIIKQPGNIKAIKSASNHKQSEVKNPGVDTIRVLGKTTVVEELIEEETEDKNLEFDKQILYRLINSHRENNKQTPLNINQSLERSAKAKVKDMIDNDYFRHQDKHNIESWYLFQAAGYNYLTAGENLSSGSDTPWKVFEAWQNSEEHNNQMLSDTFLDMGFSLDCQSYRVGMKLSCISVLHLGSR